MSVQAGVDSKRVAKNTMVLYFRMIFQMVVYLYTSRVVIRELGLEDYGIYDVVGAAIGILVFLNNSMLNCTQRFITFAIGKGDTVYLKSVFSVSVIIHLILALLILLLGETVGLWYVENRMIIPPTRFDAALWVYHCSLLSAVFVVMSVPYNSAIVAYEKMTAFAAITILDTLLKLAAVLSLSFVTGDKLKIYAMLLLAVALIVRVVYGIYCKIAFKDLSFIWVKARVLYKEMLGFAGWSTFGNFALVCNTQGMNLLLNAFGGALLNAARGAAFQVQVAVTAFTASFQTAINPQITKSYAVGDYSAMNGLVLRSSRFSFYLLLLIALPLALEMPRVLSLWLGNVPPYAVVFTRLLLCVTLVDAVANSMMIGVSATGKIKKYHIVIGCTLLSALPLAWVAVNVTGEPAMAFMAQLFAVSLAQVIRLFFCRKLFGFSIMAFVKTVLLPISKVFVCAFVPSYIVHCYFNGSIVGFLLVVVATLLFTVLSVFLLGLAADERDFIFRKIHLR